MKVLFLYPYPPGESPSQRFRFEQYYTILQKEGYQIDGQSFWDLQGWKILYKENHGFKKAISLLKGFYRRFVGILKAQRADVVFIHRECTPIGPPIVEWVIARVLKKKVIYDFDDSIWLPNTSSENKIVSSIKWHTKFNSICQWSYKISCGNFYLKKIAQVYNECAFINPTTIDTEYLHNPVLHSVTKAKNRISIGWTGTQSTLKYLDEILPAIKKLCEKYSNLDFIVICNKKPSFDLKSLIFLPWSKENEVKDLLMIDIGIMPLTNDAWAEGKCGFKVLQYMALSIPAVASPVGVNKTIVDHGLNGFLCNCDEEWMACLEQLILQPETRRKIGEAGRKKVIDHYSVSSNTASFLSLFK